LVQLALQSDCKATPWHRDTHVSKSWLLRPCRQTVCTSAPFSKHLNPMASSPGARDSQRALTISIRHLFQFRAGTPTGPQKNITWFPIPVSSHRHKSIAPRVRLSHSAP
jgi:hypothetical protein